MPDDFQLLFVYGTLKDDEFRGALFKTDIYHREAVLAEYSLLYRDGFAFVVPQHESSVRGLLLRLTSAQLQLADRWEDVPFYSRTRACVSCDGEKIEAWVYIRPGVEGYPVSLAAPMRRDAVLAEIENLLLHY